MKKYILFACTLLTLGFFASCSSCSNKNEKPREERVAEFRSTLNHEPDRWIVCSPASMNTTTPRKR